MAASTLPLTAALPPPPRRGGNDASTLDNVLRWSKDLQVSVAKLYRDLASLPANTAPGGVGGAAHSGGYASAATAGAALTFMRSDGKLEFPEALGTAADRTKAVTLTDYIPANGVPVFTPSGFVAGPNSAMAFLAPGGTGYFSIGPAGNIAIGQASPVTTPQYQLLIAKNDYNEASVAPIAFSVLLTQKNAAGIVGLDLTPITCSAVNAACSASVQGARIAVITGNTTSDTNIFTGTAYGVVVAMKNFQKTARAVGDMSAFVAFGSSGEYGAAQTSASLKAQFTNLKGLWVKSPTNAGGTCTNIYGVLVDSFSIGTNKWSFKGAQKVETATDFHATTAGRGVVMLDSANGNFYRLSTTNGVLQVTSLGATAPTS